MRWTPKKKAALLAKIDAGTLDHQTAGVSFEELTWWRLCFEQGGLRGLKTCREGVKRPWYVHILITGIIFLLGMESGIALNLQPVKTVTVDRFVAREVPVFIPSPHASRVKVDMLALQIPARALERGK